MKKRLLWIWRRRIYDCNGVSNMFLKVAKLRTEAATANVPSEYWLPWVSEEPFWFFQLSAAQPARPVNENKHKRCISYEVLSVDAMKVEKKTIVLFANNIKQEHFVHFEVHWRTTSDGYCKKHDDIKTHIYLTYLYNYILTNLYNWSL